MNLNGILIGSEDPQRLTAYYTGLFGEPGWSGGDFETPDVRGEFERLKAAGATVVQEPYQPDEDPEGWIATFSDPDDNYFQLVSPFPG
jgi:hypothetical protein